MDTSTIYHHKTAEEGYRIKEVARLKALNLTAPTREERLAQLEKLIAKYGPNAKGEERFKKFYNLK